MVDFNTCNLSLDELKDFSGGIEGDAPCNNRMVEAKMIWKFQHKGKHPWVKKPDKWSGIEMQDNAMTSPEGQ